MERSQVLLVPKFHLGMPASPKGCSARLRPAEVKLRPRGLSDVGLPKEEGAGGVNAGGGGIAGGGSSCAVLR